MIEKTMSAATMAEEGLAATCEGMARDYPAHRGYVVRAADGWSCDGVDAIRHDVVSIVVTGDPLAKLRHLIGAWQWAESRE